MQLIYRSVLFLVTLLREIHNSTETGDHDPLEKQYGVIEYAALIIRHGDRNPWFEYPNDPHRNYKWSGGIGQLTKAGKFRLFEMGQWFGERYQNLKSREYDHNEITIQSSDFDRTIMSALCFLRGFYPAHGSQIWLSNEQWQPIPVHVIPVEFDNLIVQSQECPRLQSIRLANFRNLKYQKINQDFKDEIAHIYENSGLNRSNEDVRSVFRHILWLYGTLHIQENNLTLPSWTKKVYPDLMRTITEMTILNEDLNQEGFRLLCGPILKSIVSDLRRKTEEIDFTRKLHIYSAHDSTIQSVMTALEIAVLGPPYGSTLIFELRRKGSDHFLSIMMKNTTESPHLLQIPGYKTVCTLEQFLTMTKPLLPENWSQECQIKSFSVTIRSSRYLIASLVVYLHLK